MATPDEVIHNIANVPSPSSEKAPSTDEKASVSKIEPFDIVGELEAAVPIADVDEEGKVLVNERDIATHVISVEDDPSLNPWTPRAFFIGIGLSAFGGSLAQIYYFKPQTVSVSLMFLAIISYIIGFAMETFIPRHGYFHWLNPGPFNKKENAFVIIMASAAANSALATEVLAVQRLYYNIEANAGTSIFLLFSSQLLGYGIGGILRTTLLYPSKMLYPAVLPLISMFDALYLDGAVARKKLKVFYICFFVIFFWELLPEWIFPLLTGLSVVCLAAPNSAFVSRVFGGSDGNEGLGLLSICFDWQYISGGVNPMSIPLNAQVSGCIGYVLCMVVFIGIFYGNVWQAQNFPFLSQLLFYENGTIYNQSLILNANYEVDPTLLAEQGLPYYASTWVIELLVTNLGLAATITHLILWNRDDLRSAWSWMSVKGVQERWANFDWKFWRNDGMRDQKNTQDLDPHYVEMLKYPDAPDSWYYLTFLISFIIALVVIYKSDSTLPWWGFVISVILAVFSILFFGALYAITGIGLSIQPFVQMIGGFLHPGKPMANMYFVLYSYNTVSQAQLLLRDLKIGQYAKVPPRASFVAQIIGTLLGAVLNYVLMNSIITNEFEILLSVQGTNIWSGQQPQQYNSQAVAWGGLSQELFAVGKRYQWVPWSYIVGLFAPVPFWIAHQYWPKLRMDFFYTPIICTYIGYLCVGINSSVMVYYIIAFVSQGYLRTRYPRWFVKYNYLIGAALDGGTQVMVFILSFAVQGAAGTAHLFPPWWGANQGGNYDRCAYLT
ncbi:OPT oligopeptide transporter [Coniophora puteana RWD-64-598 SS2]|uniref:OPT oligopeptide transporter n=1 Tax=Coniophora puteana (strain RWD-64-598) TaxID=741705 RepID=A0A5M3N126_CONPW|nr:OPT oligopeptide transporter [Coniophora puteana RWD-64-598 SS2]EIW85092.1 OPT oligopeptide transporter [Coniophora puteana RWD-64-598 SS2]